MALAGKCSNSKIFHSSWVWWKFWKCNHSKKKPEKREVTCQLLWCLRRGEQLVIFKMFESRAVHHNSVSLFPYYQGYICSHKAEGRSTGKSTVTQISQRSAPAVRLVGVQQCRSLSLCLRSHPTLQLHKPLSLRHCCVKGLQRHDDGKCFIVLKKKNKTQKTKKTTPNRKSPECPCRNKQITLAKRHFHEV